MIKYFPLLFIFSILSGCSEKTEEPGADMISPALEISFADDTLVEQKIKERDGKVLFINVWATWCLPCVEEFPDLVRIYNDYSESEFEFISLSVDFGNNADSLVQSFMKAQKAKFPVYIVKEESSENVINLLSKEWSGAIPATFIYSREGDLKRFILGAQTYKGFKQSIDSVLVL